MAEKYPQAAQFNSFEELLTQASIDAVIIATPSGLHYQHVLAALQAGKHVLVEKPMASSVKEARELIGEAECHDRVLMVGHTFLYNNIVHEVKKRIDSGELGDIYYTYSRRLNLGRFRRDSDVLWTLAPHDISIMNYWFESRPHQVSARGITCIGKTNDIAEVCFAHLEYPDGRSVHLHMSWLDPQKRREIVIVGSKKMLIYDDMNTDRHIQIFDKRVEPEYRHPTSNFAEFTALLRAGDLVIPNIRLVEPLSVEVNHFIECIQNESSPLTDGRHGLDVIAVLESLTHSMQREGCMVPVNY
jgi:predicted dehydrogenase